MNAVLWALGGGLVGAALADWDIKRHKNSPTAYLFMATLAGGLVGAYLLSPATASTSPTPPSPAPIPALPATAVTT
jgi:hypothetical protein